MIEVKVEPFGSNELAIDGLRSEMERLYVGPFNQTGVDHSDDDRAIELDAYEIGALLMGIDPPAVGSISGYVDKGVMYAFFIVHQAESGLPFDTSHYAWDLIESVQKNNNQFLQVILEDSIFDATWTQTKESALSCG